MAEHLSYLKSKSHSYVYEVEKKRVARADENFAREVMQLFSSECTDSVHTLLVHCANIMTCHCIATSNISQWDLSC